MILILSAHPPQYVWNAIFPVAVLDPIIPVLALVIEPNHKPDLFPDVVSHMFIWATVLAAPWPVPIAPATTKFPSSATGVIVPIPTFPQFVITILIAALE